MTILLSGHTASDVVRWSELFPAMRALNIGADRVAEVPREMGVPLDDRRPAFEDWLQRKLDGLAPGIRVAVEAWLRIMHDGGPRSTPRDIASVQNYMNQVRPTLLDWSARYDHLREVTHDDILSVLGGLHGTHRCNVLVGLRRLFAFCRKTRIVFRDPTRGIKVGQHPYGIMQPLEQTDLDQAVETATTPVARLVLVLAAVHAARKAAIITSQIEDVDLGNRRLIITGRTRPIDELTHQVLLEWLDYRRTRWPNTANLHLIINHHTAGGTGPVSTLWGNRNCVASPRPWNGCASTGNSRKPSRTARTRCTWPQSSVSIPKPRSATPRTPECSWQPQRRSKTPPVPANPRAETNHRAREHPGSW
ncbi:MAG: hypothetical protein M3Z25_11180 [Actinomycetota bacterium]|nr:hypothetical protein [Actinomycetota bacterium]